MKKLLLAATTAALVTSSVQAKPPNTTGRDVRCAAALVKGPILVDQAGLPRSETAKSQTTQRYVYFMGRLHGADDDLDHWASEVAMAGVRMELKEALRVTRECDKVYYDAILSLE